MTDAVVEPDESEEDAAYRRLVRTLYVAGLVVNLWMVWELYLKDRPDVQIEVRRLRQWLERKVFKPCRDCAEEARDKNRVVRQAEYVLATEVEVIDP